MVDRDLSIFVAKVMRVKRNIVQLVVLVVVENKIMQTVQYKKQPEHKDK